MTFQDRLKEARKEKGLTQKKLARLAGISQTAIASLEKGKHAGTAFLVEIANALGVRPEWLREGKLPKYSTDTVKVSQNNVDITQYIPQVEVRIIPILSWDEARFGIDSINRNPEKEHQKAMYSKNKISEQSFALYMKGDAMVSDNPHVRGIMEGELIYIDQSLPAQHSKTVIAILPDAPEAICRKYIEEGGVPYLVPLNKQWEKIKITNEIKIIGVMVGRLVEE